MLLCICLLLLGLVVSQNNIFSPSVLTPAIWLVCLSLFLVLDHNLPALGFQFLFGISLWLVCFCFSSMLFQSVHFSVEKARPSNLVRDVYFWISICTVPLFLMFIYRAIAFGPTGNWSGDLRLAAIGQTAYFRTPYTPFYLTVWTGAYLIELFFFSKENRLRVLLLALLNLTFAVCTFSKYLILQFFIMSIIILFFKRKIKVKYIILVGGIVFCSFFILQAIRHSLDVSDVKSSNFLVLYSIGHMATFETLEPCSSTHFGENVFRIFYAIAYALGSPIEPISPILPFVQKPLVSNTYTVLYPFFKDFGYWGIAIFALIQGAFFAWLFKKAQKGDTLSVILFSYFAFCVVMQFMSEVLFTNIAGYVKLAIVVYLAFFASKRFYYQDEILNQKT